jgi:hypothetical protein
MIGLRIAAAELREIEAGAPAVVVASGLVLPHAPPLVPLTLKDGVLARPGADATRHLPVPAGLRLLGVVGPAPAVEPLLPLLPPGLPVIPDAAALLGVLAAALREAGAARDTASAERDRLTRALATLGAPRPRKVLEVAPLAAPLAATVAPPLTQPLGRPAEGICTIELHLAEPGARGLKVVLTAGGRALGVWRVPGAALAPGWLALDLPEPAPPGPEAAVIEILSEPGDGAPCLLSCGAAEPDAPLALRAATAPEGWSVLPRWFDWAAAGAPRPALPLPLPAALLAEARIAGAGADLVAVGEEPPRLLLDLTPGASASVELPAIPAGAADLLRARIARHGQAEPPVAVALALDGTAGSRHATGWRETDADGALDLALPLPPGPMVTVRLDVRHAGAAPAIVELACLALVAGAAGEPRRIPPAAAPAAPPAAAPSLALRVAIGMPAGPGREDIGWRQAPPPPPLAAALPGGAAAPLPAASSALPGGSAFQDVKVMQHLVNADGSYRHLDMTMTGLVSAGGLWRQLRLKLFDRRGTIGLEFREMAGWPPMFDAWPGAARDAYGPFWRLESAATAEALRALAGPHDRAMIAALLEVLPDAASRAAVAAGLGPEDAGAWTARARDLVAAVHAARMA